MKVSTTGAVRGAGVARAHDGRMARAWQTLEEDPRLKCNSERQRHGELVPRCVELVTAGKRPHDWVSTGVYAREPMRQGLAWNVST